MTVKPDFGGRFPFGTHVYREPSLDLEAVLADLPLLKRLGFNMIKIQEHWGTDEPEEGLYEFGRVDRVIARAGELDLGIYLGLTMEQAPMWLWRKFPDCHLVGADGRSHMTPTQYTIPMDGKPGPCWDHPGARSAAERFIAELARQLGRHENIWAWNTFQEIGFWPNEAGKTGFCYCPHTLERFRDWLRERYGSLEALNAAWQLTHAHWQDVEPPRRKEPVAPFIDWRFFMDDVTLTRNLEFKTAVLRANDPQRRPVFSHADTPRIASGAEWRWARAADFFGTSNYPMWNNGQVWDDPVKDEAGARRNEIWEEMMMCTDLARANNGRDRALWGAEFQGGPIVTSLHISRTPTAADLRRWMLAGLACGMTGISFWNHRPERFWKEGNGFSLLDHHGESTERMNAASDTGRKVQEHAHFFSQSQPPRSQVALLVNEDLYHFFQACNGDVHYHYMYNMRGWYARLWRLGIPVDFVDATDVGAGALEPYRAALLCMPLALEADWFAHLVEYVDQGGTLISEACPGRFDRLGWTTRAQLVDGAESLFGASHESVTLVHEPTRPGRWMPQERRYGEFEAATLLQGVGDFSGHQVLANFWLQTLRPEKAEAILLAGKQVAATRNSFGQGQAILLGSFPGMSAMAHRAVDRGTDDFVLSLLADAGVIPDRCGRLLRRRRQLGHEQAWFLVNPAAGNCEELVDLEGLTLYADLTGDSVVQESGAGLTLRVPGGSLSCLLLRAQD
ncbi:MAG: beta-galactosidase [Anaerolineaceae bacterium]|nr:beta-galactosidase [Anaerolineaceae bacterium]MDE0329551.1 beta-galactosidase [Anaerolineaceae bacterium]